MPKDTPDGYGLADEPDEPRRPRPTRRDDDRPRPKKPRADRRDPDDDPPRRKPAPATKAKVKAKAKSPLWGLLILVPLIGVAVFMGVRQAGHKSAERDAFAVEMDRLVAPPAPGPVPATRGKVAIIDVVKNELHYLHESDGGPWSDMQAATPQEAASIVQVRVTDTPVREYLNGRKGVKQTFHLTVIDRATWTKVDEKSFAGGDPPESIRLKGGGGTNEPVAGEMPTKEIRAYLRGLCGG